MTKGANGKRRKRLVVFGLLGIFVVLVAVSIINRKLTSTETLQGEIQRENWPVKIMTVKPDTYVEKVVATGILRAMEEATISTEVMAKVISVQADLGDRVKKGQSLVRLDGSGYALNRENASAQLAQAKSAYEVAREQFDRKQKLKKLGHISQEEMDMARNGYESAKAQLEMAKSALSLANRNLGQTQIRSPFDGRVAARNISPGEMISPGLPIITVVKDRTMKVDLSLAEGQIQKIQTGMTAKITFPSIPGESFEGQVTRLGVAADAATGAFPVRIEIDNSDYRLLSGMRCTAEIELAKIEDAVVVSRDFVLKRNNQEVVMVAEGEGDNAVARSHNVSISSDEGQNLRVLDGLIPGERLIVVGQQNVKDTSPIHIVEIDGVPTATPEPEKKTEEAEKE